jgi:hypothetical protein
MSKWSLRCAGLGLLAVVVAACGRDSKENDGLCKTGALACHCYANDTCDAELSCVSGVCFDLSLGQGGEDTGSGGAPEPSEGGAEGGPDEGGAGSGGSIAGGGMHQGGGGSFSTAGTSGSGGNAGNGGTPPVDLFPPNPAGCALVTSCATCCETVGVYALDALAQNATNQYVLAFSASATAATAEYQLPSSDAIGAIFFRFTSPQNIGSLTILGQGAGGSLEVALVRANGKDGCIYPVVGGSLSPAPDACWGLGAGPYAVLPADQLEVRVRASLPGSAALNITGVAFGP